MHTTAGLSRDGPPPDDNFMNSFFPLELELVRLACQSGKYGAALRDYLLPVVPAKDRLLDVRKPESTAQLLDMLAPDRYPVGAWPSAGKYPLAFSQQVAINEIAARLFDGRGAFAVNGSPGTGKSTLLRDVIAMVVVKRAQLLADGVPFFTGVPERAWDLQSGKFVKFVAPVHQKFHGFELVVASSNNGAVENITTEIPAVKQVDTSWLSGGNNPGYFAELGTEILKATRTADADDVPEAWALLAAPLGNSSNNSSFLDTFWFGNGARGNKDSDEKDGAGADVGEEATKTIRELLKEKDFPSFKQALLRFNEAYGRERAISQKITRVQTAQRELRKLHDQIRHAAAEEDASARELSMIEQRRHPQYADLERTYEDAAELSDGAQRSRAAAADELQHILQRTSRGRAQARVLGADLKAHREAPPSFWANLFSLWGTQRRWETELASLTAAEREARIQTDIDEQDKVRLESAAKAAAAHADRCVAAATKAKQAAEDFVTKARRRAADAEETHEAYQAIRDEVADELDGFRTMWPDAYPDLVELTQDPAARELSSPWLTAEWNDARSKAFLAALALHKAYIGAHTEKFMANLSAVVDVIKGTVPVDELLSSSAADAWRTLFFVMPVVSTTFASFGRLFRHIDAEGLGWLLIDEAGQAAPQAAVGALWRARRAVIVGDPLQLEPIVTVPYPFQKAVQQNPTYQLPDDWVLSTTSVQQRADASMDVGTIIEPSDDRTQPLWVGAPLRVHRRCDDPMFSIANRISYNNLMVFGTNRPDAPYSVGEISTGWIDVPFPSAGTSHCNPAEITAARKVIEALRASGTVNVGRDVFLLAPFKDTAYQLWTVARDYKLDMKKVGTVHTAQGKEAPIVLLVLGGANEGARRWAATPPNLLNVAVTRAKRILVVIGSRENWARLPNFRVAVASLPELELRT